MNWSKIEIHHVRPISSFDITNFEEMKEFFNSVNTQPLLKEVRSQKGTKFDFLDYRLQFKKS